MIGLQIPTSLNERSHSSLDNTPPTWTAPEIQAVSGLDSQVNHARNHAPSDPRRAQPRDSGVLLYLQEGASGYDSMGVMGR